MRSNDSVLISFSSHGREAYEALQLGLIRSAKPHWKGDYFMRSYDGYCDEYLGVKIHLGKYPDSVKWPLRNNHAEIPYGFKPTIIQEAAEMGYRFILWCDSTIRIQQDPSPLFPLAAERGVVAWDNVGHPLKYWMSDVAQITTGLTDAELDVCPQIMACCVLFDVQNPQGYAVLQKWLELAHDGYTFQNGYGSARPEFKSTRHDQAALSGILFKYGIPLEPYGGLCYPGGENLAQGPIYFKNRSND